MKFMKLLKILEEYKYSEGDLEDLEIIANNIQNVSFLIIKDVKKQKIIDCIILRDKNIRIMLESREKLAEIFSALRYMRDNEASNGDEYTSEVLADFIKEWDPNDEF